MTAIARLRHRLTLEAPDAAPDGMGGVMRVWTSLGQVWAAIEPVSLNEALAADRRVGTLTHRLLLRKRADLTLDHRFALGARTFSIRALRETGEGRYLECLVGEERP
jgi:SPP1 family predicted phage head-tail adaptor